MSGAKILVVDDDLQIRRVMRKMLAAQGYVVSDARSGEEALDMLRRARHDLVLLDRRRPGRQRRRLRDQAVQYAGTAGASAPGCAARRWPRKPRLHCSKPMAWRSTSPRAGSLPVVTKSV